MLKDFIQQVVIMFRNSQTKEKIRQKLELRRSNAAQPIPSKKLYKRKRKHKNKNGE